MPLSVVLLAASTWVSFVQQARAIYKVAAYFEDATCDAAPVDAAVSPVDSCSGNGCMNESGVINSVACPSSYTTELESLFRGSAYLVKETYYDINCSTLIYADAYLLTGSCHPSAGSSVIYVSAQIQSDGSALVQSFDDAACSSLLLQEGIDNRTLASHACDDYLFRWYYYDGLTGSSSSTSDTPELSTGSNSSSSAGSDSSVSVGAITGICVAVVLVLVVVFRRLRSIDTRVDYPEGNDATLAFEAHSSPMDSDPPAREASSDAATSKQQTPMGQDGLWNDDTITAKRIPRDKVLVQQLLSRGAFGEVYAGLFNSEQVAIKMLLPATRGNIQNVNEFLSEAKMTAMMEHPRVISFVGVAWDSLSDLCVVLEFMDGGDLRTLLDKYISEARPVGFTRVKATIALHVCHALVYLHSLDPAIIHRDLKSRNVLLNHAMEAKLTDFGISRERLDRTMTANVGTKLWMAPEVMMGDKYDEKADMFSFGVLLSELDLHTLPYAFAKAEGSGNPQLSDTAILQKVALGAGKGLPPWLNWAVHASPWTRGNVQVRLKCSTDCS